MHDDVRGLKLLKRRNVKDMMTKQIKNFRFFNQFQSLQILNFINFQKKKFDSADYFKEHEKLRQAAGLGSSSLKT